MRILLLFFSLLFFSLCSSKILNNVITRTIELESQVSEQTVSITFVNNGNEPVKEYLYAVPTNAEGRLSFIESVNEDKEPLQIQKKESEKVNHGIRYN